MENILEIYGKWVQYSNGIVRKACEIYTKAFVDISEGLEELIVDPLIDILPKDKSK